MDNSRILRAYVAPIEMMIRRKFTQAELTSFENRVADFYRQCCELDKKRFIDEVKQEFGFEAEMARFVINDFKISIIARNVLFFFWLTIVSMILYAIVLMSNI